MKYLLLGILGAAVLVAQPAFDVASVKPSSPNGQIRDFRISPGGRLHVTNIELRLIIQEAYAIKRYQLSGGPPWINDALFDIDAKAEGDPTRPQVLAMLQKLLADRFQLKVHRETREDNIYALLVGKGGHKLTPTTADQSFVRLYRNTPANLPGVDYTIGAQKATLAQFAERLGEMQLGRPVQDHTNLKGEFDFKVRYATDDNPDTGPSIFAALQEQLGLKLEATKGPVEILVVDKAEKPTGN